MTTKPKKYLITSALPYANGPLHFGHLGGVYIPSDIYTRHRKLSKDTAIHICGSDEHGVAIMLSAEKQKTDYKSYVDYWNKNHASLFKRFDIEFDYFGRTSANYHEEEVVRWFKDLYEKELIGLKTEKQLYCKNDKKYLPDRYAEGTCYICKYAQARGDECPHCGEWIEATKLIDPKCKICGSSEVEVKEVEHFYILLKKMELEFKKWFSTKTNWRPLVTGFVKGLLEKEVVDRAISRNLDWGIDVPVPGHAGKKIYVWFDAPIGYVSNTKQMLKEKNSQEDYISDWWNNKETEIIHFIGKDNIIFHAYIWPCMAMGTKFIRCPDQIPANEFVNLEGKQFSKSAGWYVDAEEALAAFGPDALRWYICSIIPETGDSSFSWDHFGAVNEEFANKVGNFVHRSMTFLEKHWPEGLPKEAFEACVNSEKNIKHHPLTEIPKYRKDILNHLDRFEFTKAQSSLIHFSQAANEFFHEQAPWKQVKENKDLAAQTLASAVLYTCALSIFLEPFTPSLALKLQDFFPKLPSIKLDFYNSGDIKRLLSIFSEYKLPRSPSVLIQKIDPKIIALWKEKLGKNS
ncbi:MAG: methionine--tRNA ligase [Bacteriovoracia bacterium]